MGVLIIEEFYLWLSLYTPQYFMQHAVFPHDFPKFPKNVLNILGTFSISKAHPDINKYQNPMTSFAFDGVFHWLSFDILDPFEFSGGSNLEKCGNLWKNGRFFRADMAGLGKYSMGGYGRIGVHRDKYKY